MLPSENLEGLYLGRRKNLEKIIRYHAFDTMFYRTNDWIHSLRVRWLVEDVLPLTKRYFKHFDKELAISLSLVHDDAEMITGDILAGHKAIMSKQALAKVHRDERRAISLLAKRYPIKINGYLYGDLLLEAFEKKSVEAQFVSYLDKIDSYCESLHEVYAGNFSFVRSIIFNTAMLAQPEKKFPKLKPMLGSNYSVFTDLRGYLQELEVKGSDYSGFGKPFSKKSIKLPSQLPFYNRWRTITLERGGKEGLDALTKQKEFEK